MQNLLEPARNEVSTAASELDSYLATLGKEIAPLPQEERDAAQVELRQHLESIVAAQIELGTPLTEAVETAVAQFGDARNLGKTIRHQWNEHLVPTDLHAALIRVHFLTLLPAQFIAPLMVYSPQHYFWGAVVLFAINAMVGWNLGRRFPALGSTTVLVYQFAFWLAVPVATLLFTTIPQFRGFEGVMLGVGGLLSLANVFAAVCAHCCVVVRAGSWVPYPIHELRLLPKRAYLMVARRGDASAEVTRQWLR